MRLGVYLHKKTGSRIAAGAGHGVGKLSCIKKKVLLIRELRIHRGHFGLEVVDVFLTDWLCIFAFPRE